MIYHDYMDQVLWERSLTLGFLVLTYEALYLHVSHPWLRLVSLVAQSIMLAGSQTFVVFRPAKASKQHELTPNRLLARTNLS